MRYWRALAELRRKAFTRTGESLPIIVIQEAGLDGFWIHRVLQQEGIEGHVVDPASIATSRRRRGAKTDRIGGETLLRALLAYKRGNRGCVRWSRRRPLRKRTAAGFAASAILARRIRLRSVASRPPATARRAPDGRRPPLAEASQDSDRS